MSLLDLLCIASARKYIIKDMKGIEILSIIKNGFDLNGLTEVENRYLTMEVLRMYVYDDTLVIYIDMVKL